MMGSCRLSYSDTIGNTLYIYVYIYIYIVLYFILFYSITYSSILQYKLQLAAPMTYRLILWDSSTSTSLQACAALVFFLGQASSCNTHRLGLTQPLEQELPGLGFRVQSLGV